MCSLCFTGPFARLPVSFTGPFARLGLGFLGCLGQKEDEGGKGTPLRRGRCAVV